MSIFDRFGQGLGRFWGGFGEGLEEVLGGSGSILGAFGCFWGALGRLLGPFAAQGGKRHSWKASGASPTSEAVTSFL